MNKHQLNFLRSISIFSRLSEDDLQDVAAGFHVRVFSREAFLFMEGDDPTTFFVMAAGRVRLFKTSPQGREFTFAIRRSRHFFDVPPLFDGKSHPVSARALTDARLYITTLMHMREMMTRHPQLYRALAVKLSAMMRSMADTASAMAFTDVSTRLARLLVISARNDGRETPQGVMLEWGLSQSEVAHLLGTAREVVSRTLRQLEKSGMVERTHNGILIRDWHALEKIAHASSP